MVRNDPGSIVVVALAVLTPILVYAGIHYGVEFHDETFGLALAHRFWFGDVPLVDELNPAQGAGLIHVPIYAFVYKLLGGPEGIVLWSRKLFLLLKLLLCAFTFRELRKAVPWQFALALSTVIFLAIPAKSTSGGQFFSYNSFAASFSVLAVLLLTGDPARSPSPLRLGMAGFFYALAVIAHPGFGAGVITLTLAVAALEKKRALWFVFGGLVVLSACLPWALKADWASIRQLGANGSAYEWALSYNFILMRRFLFFLLIGVAAYRVSRSCGFWVVNLVPLLAFVAFGISRTGERWEFSSGNFPAPLLFWALTFPAIFLANGRDEVAKRWLWLGWWPALASGLGVAQTSTGGYGAAVNALGPVILANGILLARQQTSIGGGSRWFAFPLAPVLLIGILLAGVAYPHRDEPVWRLKERVTIGPFAGIKTGLAKRNCTHALTEALEPYRHSGMCLATEGFTVPSAYLSFASGTPAPTIYFWVCSQVPEVCKRRFSGGCRGEPLVIRASESCGEQGFQPVADEPQPTAVCDLFRWKERKNNIDFYLRASGQ